MPAQPISAPLVRQFVKYGLVGASNTAIGFGLYVVLYKLLGIEYLIASSLGYAIGAVNSYMLNRHWTFRAQEMSHAESAPRFALVQACADGANVGLLYALVNGAGLAKIPAQAVVTVVIVVATFGVNRAWSFAHRQPEPR